MAGATLDRDAEVHEVSGLQTIKSRAGGTFNDDGTVNVVILRPCHGRGFANAIYEAPMLERDAGVFEGWPMFLNHSEDDLPGRRRGRLPRSPAELAGEIRESWWDEKYTTPKDARLGFSRGAVIGRAAVTESSPDSANPGGDQVVGQRSGDWKDGGGPQWAPGDARRGHPGRLGELLGRFRDEGWRGRRDPACVARGCPRARPRPVNDAVGLDARRWTSGSARVGSAGVRTAAPARRVSSGREPDPRDAWVARRQLRESLHPPREPGSQFGISDGGGS